MRGVRSGSSNSWIWKADSLASVLALPLLPLLSPAPERTWQPGLCGVFMDSGPESQQVLPVFQRYLSDSSDWVFFPAERWCLLIDSSSAPVQRWRGQKEGTPVYESCHWGHLGVVSKETAPVLAQGPREVWSLAWSHLTPSLRGRRDLPAGILASAGWLGLGEVHCIEVLVHH